MKPKYTCTKPLRFELPLTRTVIDLSRRNGKRVDHVGDLLIIGDVTYCPTDKDDPHHVDYEKILLNGADLMPLFESDQGENFRESIMDAVMEHCQYLFPPEADNEPHSYFDKFFYSEYK